MALKAIFGIGLAAFALIVSAAQLGDSINRSYIYVLVAWATTAFLFSMATTGGDMAGREEGSGVIKAKGFGGEITLPAKAANAIILALALGLGFFIWQHHTESVAWSQKIYAATERNTRAIIIQTYVSTLSPEKKSQLNLDMPEELRQMQRHRGE